MTFSIITAVKNNKESLRRAITSLRAQTFKDYEHIIVDGASADGTAELIKILADEKRNWRSQPDNGIYFALNEGLKLASGKIVCLLHSDDILAKPEVLEKVAQVFEERNIDSVYSDLMYISKVKEENIKENKGKVIRLWKSGEFKHSSLRFGWMPPHPTLFIRKEIFEKYGLYRTDMKIASDYEMILRLFYKHKITTHYLPLTTYLMSVGGTSNKSVKNILLKSKEDLLALKLHEVPHPLITLISKNFRKLPQFMTRDLS